MSCKALCTASEHESKPDDAQIWQRLPRRHQPNVVANVRNGQHLRGVPSPTVALPQSDGSFERRSCSFDDEGTEKLRSQGQG
jgi:hypothetical protein